MVLLLYALCIILRVSNFHIWNTSACNYKYNLLFVSNDVGIYSNAPKMLITHHTIVLGLSVKIELSTSRKSNKYRYYTKRIEVTRTPQVQTIKRRSQNHTSCYISKTIYCDHTLYNKQNADIDPIA